MSSKLTMIPPRNNFGLFLKEYMKGDSVDRNQLSPFNETEISCIDQKMQKRYDLQR